MDVGAINNHGNIVQVLEKRRESVSQVKGSYIQHQYFKALPAFLWVNMRDRGHPKRSRMCFVSEPGRVFFHFYFIFGQGSYDG